MGRSYTSLESVVYSRRVSTGRSIDFACSREPLALSFRLGAFSKCIVDGLDPAAMRGKLTFLSVLFAAGSSQERIEPQARNHSRHVGTNRR